MIVVGSGQDKPQSGDDQGKLGAWIFRSTRRWRRCWPSRWTRSRTGTTCSSRSGTASGRSGSATAGGGRSGAGKTRGLRSIVFRDGGEVEIGSRNERPMTRYFPELVAAVKAELPERCVIDGEIVIPDAQGRRLEFEGLRLRIHPAASRVELLATQTPGHFMAFDPLALGEVDYMERPFAERR